MVGMYCNTKFVNHSTYVACTANVTDQGSHRGTISLGSFRPSLRASLD